MNISFLTETLPYSQISGTNMGPSCKKRRLQRQDHVSQPPNNNQLLGRPVANIEIELGRIPLPSNWEIATRPEGHQYFVDHAMQTTTNEDPRLQIRKEFLQKHIELCEKHVCRFIFAKFQKSKQKIKKFQPNSTLI